MRNETKVIGLVRIEREGKSSRLLLPDKLTQGEEGGVILEETPFYGEAGGQVGDKGIIETPTGKFLVQDTQINVEGFTVHIGKVIQGEIYKGQEAKAQVDEDLRRRTMGHHTATHLLHAALRKVLGPHVYQTGSLVAPDRLRFDFTHFSALSLEEIKKIEDMVNTWIIEDLPVIIEHKPLEVAKEEGAIALFTEKYSEVVRTVRVVKNGSTVSYELCGGTHVQRTGQIGLFKIISEKAIALGVRRIEAKTGKALLEHYRERDEILEETARALKTSDKDLPKAVSSLLQEMNELKAQLRSLEDKLAFSVAERIIASEREAPIIVSKLDVPPSALLRIHDILKVRIPDKTYILLAPTDGDKYTLLINGPEAETLQEKLRELGVKVGGKRGGIKRGSIPSSKLDLLKEVGNSLVKRGG